MSEAINTSSFRAISGPVPLVIPSIQLQLLNLTEVTRPHLDLKTRC